MLCDTFNMVVRSYIETIDSPTILYVLYSMVIVRLGCALCSNRELKFCLREVTALAFSKHPSSVSARKDGTIRHCDITIWIRADQ